ncbi:MAG: dolichyl-phosphate beta-glucosyltransferase [Chloroflexota bacterium]
MTYDIYQKWKTEPLNQPPFISVVIPAYNEEVRIIPTVGAIASHISGLGYPWELIIADDGSTDRTIEFLRRLSFANMRILIAEENEGKGSAVRRGVLAAQGKYILFGDADNSTPIEEVSKLIRKLHDEGFDMAIGSRAVDGAEETKRNLLRQTLSGGLRLIVRNMFNIGVKDTQCGFKMYRRDVAKRLHTAQTIMGFSFDLEILYLAEKFGYKIAEVPVVWVEGNK